MTRAELLALAERVEAATGPDRALEEEIDLVALDLGWRAERKEVPFEAPRYMSSRDAAASLMPPGWCVIIRVGLHPGKPRTCAVLLCGDAADEPRARLAAALRARAEEVGDG